MIIGLPKEIKDNEYRVGLTPAGVKIALRARSTVPYAETSWSIPISATRQR